MEQNAKQLLKRISDKIGVLTDKEISRVSHAPQEKEWRAYIAQKAPHWEDIAWRVKEPNSKGEAEIHLGFYSAKPSELLNDAIEKAETLAKSHANHLVKNENGIRLVWKANLNDSAALDKLYLNLEGLLNDFLVISFDVLITSEKEESKSLFSNQDDKYSIFSKIEYLMNKITLERDTIKAIELSAGIKSTVDLFPELHWTLYVSRMIKKTIIQNCEEDEQEEIINFCDNFNFCDVDNIVNKCIIEINHDQLNELDFFYNTSIQTWLNRNGGSESFIDCVSEIWDFEAMADKIDDSLLITYFENSLITTILVNLRNYAKPKFDLDSNIYAKIIWTILENNIELTNSEILKSKYDVEYEGFELALDSVSFCIEKILSIELSENFNSEIDNSYTSYNGYSNDYIAISEELLDRDIFDD